MTDVIRLRTHRSRSPPWNKYLLQEFYPVLNSMSQSYSSPFHTLEAPMMLLSLCTQHYEKKQIQAIFTLKESEKSEKKPTNSPAPPKKHHNSRRTWMGKQMDLPSRWLEWLPSGWDKVIPSWGTNFNTPSASSFVMFASTCKWKTHFNTPRKFSTLGLHGTLLSPSTTKRLTTLKMYTKLIT